MSWPYILCKDNPQLTIHPTYIHIILSNICAVIIAFETFARGGCEDICDTDCNPNQFMDVSVFLQIVGFSMMALSTIGVCSHFLICPNSNDPTTPSKKQLIFNIIIIIYYVTWVGIGFYIREQLRDECKDTPKYKMFFAWCIIYSVSAAGSIYNLLNQNFCDKKGKDQEKEQELNVDVRV